MAMPMSAAFSAGASVQVALDLPEEIYAIHEVGQPVELVRLEHQDRREIIALESVLVEQAGV
jgi:hypothetical protein